MLGERVTAGLLKDRTHGRGELLLPGFAAQHRLGRLLLGRGLGRRGAVGGDDAATAPNGLGGGSGGGLDLGARRGRGAHAAHRAVVEVVAPPVVPAVNGVSVKSAPVNGAARDAATLNRAAAYWLVTLTTGRELVVAAASVLGAAQLGAAHGDVRAIGPLPGL